MQRFSRKLFSCDSQEILRFWGKYLHRLFLRRNVEVDNKINYGLLLCIKSCMEGKNWVVDENGSFWRIEYDCKSHKRNIDTWVDRCRNWISWNSIRGMVIFQSNLKCIISRAFFPTIFLNKFMLNSISLKTEG